MDILAAPSQSTPAWREQFGRMLIEAFATGTLGQIIGFLLTLLFFLTPICYPEESLPAGLVWYFRRNPIYILVYSWRAVLLSGALPPPRMMLLLYVTSLAVVFLAAHLYRKLRPTFADVL